jgi:hypothetical protein
MGFRKFRQYRDRLTEKITEKIRDESGQSIILISVVILSFLMFFQFAVSTGLLINAKISVQAAADAAAYAGAATQARQMNAISYLNYDMRQQYKKFLFRYVFIGSMGSANFPNTPANPQLKNAADYDFEKIDYSQSPRGNPKGMNVPVVCIPLTAAGTANDNCSVVNLPNTTAGLANSLNSAEDLIKQLNNIQSIQNSLCSGQGDMNLLVLMTWLFRSGTSTSSIQSFLTTLSNNQSTSSQANIATLLKTIDPLTTGLGLYPRNIITLMRINTLLKFINQPAETDISQDSVQGWINAPNAEARERTLQAFQSALANLNDTVFDLSSVLMDEMQADTMLSSDNVAINFNAYVQHMSGTASLSTNIGSGPICQSQIDPFAIMGVPIGVHFTPHVNYAVHLKAFVKSKGILYLPNSEPLELDAYAGAKPFGSRLGPADSAGLIAQLTTTKTPAIINSATPPVCNGDPGCKVPYLSIGAGASMYSINYLQELSSVAKINNAYSTAGIIKAQAQAMAPTLEEVGHYNILPPAPGANAADISNNMSYEFIPYTKPNDPIYRFYAPIYPNTGGDVSAIVDGFLDQVFPKTQIGNNGNAFGFSLTEMKSNVRSQILGYINTVLPAGTNSENGETTTFAALAPPIPQGLSPVGQFWLTQASQVMSSWGPQSIRTASSTYGFTPRFGYSVKFVTMHDLEKQGVQDEDGDLDNLYH